MRYVSVFSGIEAASVAWGSLGWEPVAFSEIEPFPSAVLATRYPRVPNLGDITKIDWSKHDDCRTADLLVGGSPCQSFSVAGSRTGLNGASGLMWEYVRAVRELRPRWLVWENVPGALSSSHGEDFACLLRALDGLGYGLAWRVLDAQFYGVAQRRRRVYLVGSLGDQRACDVLFEPDCLRWDHPTGREKRQALAGQAQGGPAGADGGGGRLTPRADTYCMQNSGSGPDVNAGMSPTLLSSDDKQPKVVACLTPWDTQSRRIYRPDGAWPTLDARARSGGDGRAVALDYHPQDSRIRYADEDVSQTLSARMGTGGNNIPLVQETKSVAFLPNAGHRAGSMAVSEELSPTLKTDHNPAVLCATDSGANAAVAENLAPTLTAHEGKSASYVSGYGPIRRLTPVECERLQGFKDGWTDVPYRGREHAPDSPRYKALGNSMAVPVMAWIGRRIQQAEEGCHDVA